MVLSLPPDPVMTRCRLERCILRALPTDEGFVYLNFTAEFGSRLILHSFTDAVEHEPSRLLSDPQVTTYLVTRNTVLAVRNQPYG
jgi:hypothetical protein